MKRDTREMYVTALTEHARRKTIGATAPVVVSAYRFFDEACDKKGYPHTFTAGDAKKILSMFDEDLRQACHSDEDGFPISVLKMPKEVIKTTQHGKQAVFDADRTPEHYRTSATVTGKNPYEGWALFGPTVPRDHPIVNASLSTERKRIESTYNGFNAKVDRVAPAMRIGANGQAKLESV